MADDKIIKVTPYSDGSGAKIDVYSKDPKDGPHDSIHIKVNTNEGTFQTITKIDDTKETSSGSCYLTTACMKYLDENFDDECYELTTLRWFRDTFVKEEDIKHYYKIAPYIVEGIEADPDCDIIYSYIYENVIDPCIKAIEKGNYEFAYDRYKSSILALEEDYAKKPTYNKQNKVLKKVK